MLNFKIFVLNGLAGPYRKFLGVAVKKFGNFTRPITDTKAHGRALGTLTLISNSFISALNEIVCKSKSECP